VPVTETLGASVARGRVVAGGNSLVRCGIRRLAVGYNFLGVERDRAFLMPPSLTEWLEEDP